LIEKTGKCDLIKKVFPLQALIIICLSFASAKAQYPTTRDLSPTPLSFEIPLPPLLIQTEGKQNLAKLFENVFHVNLGAGLLELKAAYLEKREAVSNLSATLEESSSRRYFNLLATSSLAVSNLTGEGELAYNLGSPLPGQFHSKEFPRMLRLGLKDRWQGLSYGVDYRSTDKGFVPLGGIGLNQPRDEGQLWMEHSLGPVSIRGSLGESWEKLSDENRLRVTRTAATLLKFTRSEWGGTLASAYSLLGDGAGSNLEKTVYTNTFTGAYRPIGSLSLAPTFSMTEEWDRNTGLRTDTPLTGLAVVYSPSRDSFEFTSNTSYTRNSSGNGLNDTRTFATTAAISWKVGMFLRREETLSFNINYHHQLDLNSSNNFHNDVSGMVQLKIIGF